MVQGRKAVNQNQKNRHYSSYVSDLPAEDRLAKRSKQPNVTSKASHQQPVNLSAIGVDCSKQPVITPEQLSSSVEVTINPNQPLTLATHHTRSTSSITPPSSSNAVASPTVIQSSSAQNIIPQSATNAIASPTVIRSPPAQNKILHSASKCCSFPYRISIAFCSALCSKT